MVYNSGNESGNFLGEYIKGLSKTPLLTANEERYLGWRIINDGDSEAKEYFMKANLRLVVSVAKKFRNRGLGFEELIAEGNFGLAKAVNKFDPAKGNKFSTFGIMIINQVLGRAIAENRGICHIPDHVYRKVFLANAAYQALYEEDGVKPNELEVYSEINGPRPSTRDESAVYDKKKKRFSEYVRMGRIAMLDPLLAGSTSRDEDDDFEIDFGDPESINTLEAHFQEDMTRRIIDNMVFGDDGKFYGIDERDRKVLKMRNGLDGRGVQTLVQVGREIGVTKERVRQIERIAIRKLRRSAERLVV